MKEFLNRNVKLFIGIFIGIIISGVGAYGATLLTTNEVMYTDTKTAKTAIDELYSKVNSMYTSVEYSSYGTTKYNEGYTAGQKSITDSPKTLTLGSTNGTAVSVTAGYYNKVNTTAVYNAGYNAGLAAGKSYASQSGKIQVELGTQNSHYNGCNVEVYLDGNYIGSASYVHQEHVYDWSSKKNIN